MVDASVSTKRARDGEREAAVVVPVEEGGGEGEREAEMEGGGGVKRTEIDELGVCIVRQRGGEEAGGDCHF